KIGEQSGPKMTDLLLVRPRVVVGKSRCCHPRDNANAAIERDFAVQARTWGRGRAERVTQHVLAPLGSWHRGSQTRLPLSPRKPKLTMTRRTAPSYGGCRTYLIGLSPLYFGLGRSQTPGTDENVF